MRKLMSCLKVLPAAALTAGLLAGGAYAAQARYDVAVPSTPQTVVRGVISAKRPPVARIRSGQTVRIDTISHGGLVDDPVAFFAQAGIPANQVLKDVIDVAKLPRTEGFGGHVLTGPIYVDGAEPGDMLEIRIIDVESRVPYGVNNPGPGGVAPSLVSERQNKIIKFDPVKGVAFIAPGVTAPIAPFQGIMALAPRPEIGEVGSRAPGEFGGNLDFRALKKGATLYLPVFNAGGLFYTGDSHAMQGDGEVSGNAVEASNTVTLQFIVHKGEGKAMRFPYAEDADNYYLIGMDKDLNVAYRYAVEEAVKFLQRTKGMSPADAYSLASVAIDFGVAQAVDENLGAYGAIPKSFFAQKTSYWSK